MTGSAHPPLRPWAELLGAGLVVLVPLPVPPLVILVALASVSLALREQSWLSVAPGDAGHAIRLLLGLPLGLGLGLGLQVLVGPASVSMLLVQGHGRAALAGLLLALATAAANEMFFRGYVISQMPAQLGRARSALGVLVGASLAALAESGNLGAALAVFVLGLGFGMLYLAGRGSVALPMGVHLGLLVQPLLFEFAGW